MKNPKTTLIGFAAAVCLIGYKLLTHAPITGEDITMALGLVGLGVVSKDHNTTGV